MPRVIIPTGNALIRNREKAKELDRAMVRPKLLYFGPFGRLTFWFPYAPREVSYSNLAAQHNEIRRPGGFPIIDRVAPQLMQVSMEFRVADPKSNGLKPCENRLETLRGMALFPGSVLVSDMDAFLSRPIFPTVVWMGVRWAWFRITDLNIDIVQRDLFNRATQADVRMTLTEDRNPYVPAAVLPPITYEEEPQRQSAGGAAAAATDAGAPPAAGSGPNPFSADLAPAPSKKKR